MAPVLAKREITNVGQLKAMEKKAIVLEALAAQGFNDHQASKLMGIAPSYPAALKEKRDKGLLAPLAKLARRRVKDVLSGTAIENTEKAKTSDVLKCVEMVMDRADPKIQRVENKSLSVHMDVTSEDAARYMSILGIQPEQIAPQDVVIEQITSPDKDINSSNNNELRHNLT